MATLPPHGLEQPGHPKDRLLVQFERISEGGFVLAPHNDIYRFQAGQGFEKDPGVTDGGIAAFDERVAQIPGQVRVLEVGRMIGPRGEQHDARIIAMAWCQADQGLAQSVKK